MAYGYVPGDNKKKGGQWTATGAQFAVPYVFKSLFTHEDIAFDDMCETMSVTSALYLRAEGGEPEFVGRVGQFCPIMPGCGGKELLREGKDKDGNVKYSAATGSKGYLWLESEEVRNLGREDDIDRSYYEKMVEKAVETIGKFGDVEMFTDVDTVPQYIHPVSSVKNADAPEDIDFFENVTPCKSSEFKSCWECPHFSQADGPWFEPLCAKNFDMSDIVPF